MNPSPQGPPSRWGPLPAQSWPQMSNRVPSAGGMWMPHVEVGNAERAKQESFTMSDSIKLPSGTVPENGVVQRFVATDQDGDFWCDQMYMVAWFSNQSPSARPPPSTVAISDGRTGRSLTFPGQIPTNFITTLLLFSDDAGFAPDSPLPDGFRSTTTLAQPFCFTRSGGIQISYTILAGVLGAADCTLDIAFGGWKEYEFASA